MRTTQEGHIVIAENPKTGAKYAVLLCTKGVGWELALYVDSSDDMHVYRIDPVANPALDELYGYLADNRRSPMYREHDPDAPGSALRAATERYPDIEFTASDFDE